MKAVQQLLTEHLAIWTDADTAKRSGRGRSSGNAASVYGVKKLRELILELAVRGKLVPQDVNDEPAKELLKRIQAEKAKLVAKGKIKKDKPLAPISDEEKPFELPAGWEWIHLAESGVTSTGGTPKTSDAHLFEGDIPFIGPGQISPDGRLLEAEKYLTEEGVLHSSLAVKNDILMVCIGGSIGKSLVVDCKLTFNQQINCVKPVLIHSHYLNCAMNSISFQNELLLKSTGSATPIINRSKWDELLVTLPPLSEQHRIVAKVDELMALCDQLETQHNNAAEAHEKIVKVLLESLTSPLCHRGARGDFGDFFTENWQRIAAHFDTLFTTEASIDALKQTLLQLAVMGKLVPQDANDEPAEELLKRIQAEKEKLVKAGKIKNDKFMQEIAEDESLFELPNGWKFSRLGDVMNVLNGRAYKKHEMLSEGTPLLRVGNLFTSNEWYYSDLELEPEKYIDNGDLIYAWSASFGPFIWQGGKVIYHYHIWKMDFFSPADVDKYFLRNYLEAISASIKASGNGIAMMHMTKERMEKLVLPIPPLAEQHRIVAKVDEIMAICDQLKTRITTANQLQQKLADVVVENALT